MESEKVKEIKKVLECCYILTNKDLPMETRDNACNNCPYCGIERCSPLLVKNSLTYVNELESENESCYEVLADLKAIIKQQNDRIAELEKENKRLDKVVKYNQELIENGKLVSSEQLKQFAERLKEKISKGEYLGQKYKLTVFRDIDIDETLNEFLKGE